jgi:hypothetical protein
MVVNEQPVDGYYSGDTLKLIITTKDEDGNVIDLRNTDIEWALAESIDPSTIVLTKTVGNGIDFIDAQNGQFKVTIDPSDTADLSGRYQHEIEITDTQGDVTTVLTGRFQIREDIIE